MGTNNKWYIKARAYDHFLPLFFCGIRKACGFFGRRRKAVATSDTPEEVVDELDALAALYIGSKVLQGLVLLGETTLISCKQDKA